MHKLHTENLSHIFCKTFHHVPLFIYLHFTSTVQFTQVAVGPT